MDALPCVRRCSWWVPAVKGRIIFLPVIWTHFLACKDVAGRSQQSGGKRFFHEIRWPVRWVPAVRWRNHYFPRGASLLRQWTQLSASPRTVHVRWKSFLVHVNHAAPTAPGRWMTVRPRKGTTASRGRRGRGSPRGEEDEGALVRLRCEAGVAVGPGQRWE